MATRSQVCSYGCLRSSQANERKRHLPETAEKKAIFLTEHEAIKDTSTPFKQLRFNDCDVTPGRLGSFFMSVPEVTVYEIESRNLRLCRQLEYATENHSINNYSMRLSMLAIIIKAKVCVIC